MSTGIHHHVLRSVSLSIHPCICPSLCSSSHPSIYLAIHEFIWTWTFLAIFRSSDPCVHRSFHLPVYCRSFSLSSHPSFDLSLDVRMDLAKHRSVYVSIDLVARLSIDLAIKSHGIYSLLCFQNRCLPEGPLRYFPSSADGCMIGFGDKTDAKPRRDTDGLEEASSRQRSNENTGNNRVICCRLESVTRKDTRFM